MSSSPSISHAMPRPARIRVNGDHRTSPVGCALVIATLAISWVIIGTVVVRLVRMWGA